MTIIPRKTVLLNIKTAIINRANHQNSITFTDTKAIGKLQLNGARSHLLM